MAGFGRKKWVSKMLRYDGLGDVSMRASFGALGQLCRFLYEACYNLHYFRLSPLSHATRQVKPCVKGRTV